MLELTISHPSTYVSELQAQHYWLCRHQLWTLLGELVPQVNTRVQNQRIAFDNWTPKSFRQLLL